MYSILLLFCLVICSIFVVLAGGIGIYYCFSSSFFKYPPPIPTNKLIKKAIASDLENILIGPTKTVMDLGSGWGGFLILLAQKFPNHRFIGIEKNFLPFLVSRLRARKLSNISFQKGDFFQSDISQADVVFIYLINHMMPRFTQKCLSEIKKGAYVYANHFPLTNITPIHQHFCSDSFHRFYVYRMK